jgi:membrane-associated HD superfamily phosphohydrolase
VLAILEEHHGTTVVQYFFDKASENGAQLPETEFRYPGPKPRSAEAALVMLADGSEAAVRAMAKPTVPKIEQTVRRVVKSRLDDGQLDESELTLAQIEDVIAVYTRMLAGVYHNRIEYGRPQVRTATGETAPAVLAEGTARGDGEGGA